MKKTSVEAYRAILSHLPKVYRTICEVLWASKVPMTSLEIDQRSPIRIESDKRMAEMVRKNLVSEVGVRRCTVSGRNATVYQVTGHGPVQGQEQRSRRSRPNKNQLNRERDEAVTLLNTRYTQPSATRAYVEGVYTALDWALGMCPARPVGPGGKNVLHDPNMPKGVE